MNKVVLTLFTITFLSGCVYQNVDNNDIRKGNIFCSDRGGVHSIASAFDGTVIVECMTGDRVNLRNFKQ